MEQSVIEARIYEAKKRMEWMIDGYFIHCMPLRYWTHVPTEVIVQNYNVEMSYFRPEKITNSTLICS